MCYNPINKIFDRGYCFSLVRYSLLNNLQTGESIMETTTKKCCECKACKSTSEFNKCSNAKDKLSYMCKECLSKYRKKYKENNIEKIKQYQKNHSSKNENKIKKWEYEKERRKRDDVKQKMKENNKKSYNTEKAKQKRIKYYEENRDKILQRQEKKRLKNIDNFKSIQKKYRQTEKGKISEKNKYHKRRTKYKDGDVTNQQLKELYQNTKVCYWCNNKLIKNDIHLDHYLPLSKGGRHTISNLVLACSSCNLSKSSKDPIIFAIEKGRLL